MSKYQCISLSARDQLNSLGVQKLTSLALRLAHMVVKDVRKTITVVRQRAVGELAEPSRASLLMKEAQQQLTLKAHRCVSCTTVEADLHGNIGRLGY